MWENDLTWIDARVAAALAGSAQLVALEGDEAVGKSALLGTVASHLLSRGFHLLQAAADGNATEWSVLRALLDGVPEHRWESLPGSAGDLDAVRRQHGATVDPAAAAFAFAELLASLGDEGPLAVLVDDLHRCDPASASALAYGVKASAKRPIIAVVTHRPGASVVDLGRVLPSSARTALTVAGWSAAATQEHLATRWSVTVGRVGAELIREESGGRPAAVDAVGARLARAGASLLDPTLWSHEWDGRTAADLDAEAGAARQRLDLLRAARLSVMALHRTDPSDTAGVMARRSIAAEDAWRCGDPHAAVELAPITDISAHGPLSLLSLRAGIEVGVTATPRAIRVALETADDEGRARAILALLATAVTAEQTIDPARLVRAISELEPLDPARVWAAQTLACTGRRDDAMALDLAIATAAGRDGNLLEEIAARGRIIGHLTAMGRSKEAIAEAVVWELLTEGTIGVPVAVTWADIAVAHALAGRIDDAHLALGRALGQAVGPRDAVRIRGRACRVLGALGRWQRAATEARRCLDLSIANGVCAVGDVPWSEMVEVFLRARRRPDAEAAVARLLPRSVPSHEVARCRALLESDAGDNAAALQWWTIARDEAVAAGASGNAVSCAIAMAPLLHGSGRRTEAVTMLADSRAWAANAGSLSFVGRIDAATERIHGASWPGVTLTRDEAAVAALVAAGRSNRQIADELHLRMRVVEAHVFDLGQYLGLASRDELAAYWHARSRA